MPGVPGGGGGLLSQEGRPLGNHHFLAKACKSSLKYLGEGVNYVTGLPSCDLVCPAGSCNEYTGWKMTQREGF